MPGAGNLNFCEVGDGSAVKHSVGGSFIGTVRLVTTADRVSLSACSESDGKGDSDRQAYRDTGPEVVHRGPQRYSDRQADRNASTPPSVRLLPVGVVFLVLLLCHDLHDTKPMDT